MFRVIAHFVATAVGLGLLLYPQAVAWQQARETAAQLTTFHQAVSSPPVADTGEPQAGGTGEPRAAGNADQGGALPEGSRTLAAAQEYNRQLTSQPLTAFDAADADTDAEYQGLLRIGDTQLMGEVMIPAIDVRLPLFHGTAEEVLTRGAGHVYGSSLPVGGPGTHSVISAHAHLYKADMFTNLGSLTLGDEFYIYAGGQMLRYVVDQVVVVLPEELDYLKVVPGQDHVTLLTCTPVGINSHRLLVRGIRAGTAPVAPLSASVPFPWFIVWFACGLGASGMYSKALAVRAAKKAADD